MAAFLATQLDFIFFFYGLAFILLGIVCFAIAKARGQQSAGRSLGLFGIIHGAGEWLDLIALIVADTIEFTIVRTAIMAGSYLFLMEFARKTAIQHGLKPPEQWVYFPLVLAVVVAGAIGGINTAGIIARYAIGLPAGIATSMVFVAHARNLSGAARGMAILAAIAMALYAVAAGAIVPPGTFWPANSINHAWFIQLAGAPIQLLRGLLACVLTFSLWAIWGQLLSREVGSERYTAYLRRQFFWTVAAMMTIVVLGWVLTQFLGGIYTRNIRQTAQGDITLLASRLAGDTALADGMVRSLAGSSSLLPLLTAKSGDAERNARRVLHLNVETAGARRGIILDVSGIVVASSDGERQGAAAAPQSAVPLFEKSLAGEAGSELVFDVASGERFYYASAPIRSDDGSVVGVAVLQKSLNAFEADLRQFSRPYFLIDPDGVVLLTNRPDMMKRTLWPLPAERKAMLARQLGPLNDRPVLDREAVDATWPIFNGERDYLRRSYVAHSQWSLIIVMPSARIFASRILGIVCTLLVTIIVLIYFFGREHGVRDRIQVEQRMELQKLALDLRLQATTDRLTGLYNRSKFDEALAGELARTQRYNSPLALIIYDVDHFKQVNDIYGHQTGDNVLVRLSQIVSKQIRSTDLLARWGGEEFVILIPGLDGATAHRTAEKLKAAVEAAGFDAVVGKITCSFGVSEYFEGDTAETLMARADHALYRAKMKGRNRAELAPLPAPDGDEASVA